MRHRIHVLVFVLVCLPWGQSHAQNPPIRRGTPTFYNPTGYVVANGYRSGYSTAPIFSNAGYGLPSGNSALYNLRGTAGSSFNAGNATFYNFNNGLNGYSIGSGNSTLYNFNNGNMGSSYNAGNATFYNFGNGNTGYSIGSGSSTLYNFNNSAIGSSFGGIPR